MHYPVMKVVCSSNKENMEETGIMNKFGIIQKKKKKIKIWDGSDVEATVS